jgi:tetratricopeptide (TPR) repeat protein
MIDLLNRVDPDVGSRKWRKLRGEVLTRRAHARHLEGRVADRDRDLQALVSLAESSNSDRLRLLAAIHRIRYLNLGGEYANAIAEGEGSLSLARRMGDVTGESRLLAHVGFAHYFLGQPRQALAALEGAIDASEEKMEPEMRGRITHILGYVYYHLGHYERALAYQQEAYDCSHQIGDYNRMSWNLMDVGFLHLKRGHLSRAKECLTESLELARRIDARPAEAYATTLLGDWQLHQGDYVAALDRFLESLGMQRAVDSKHGIVAAEDGAGFAAYQLGDLGEARTFLQGALEQAREIGHQRHIALALIGLGLVGMARAPDHPDSVATEKLLEGLRVARESDCRENAALALAALARAERLRGDPAAAEARGVEAVTVAQSHGLRPCEVWAHAEVALALLDQEKPEDALVHSGCAVAGMAGAHEAWMPREEIHRAHGRVLEALGRDGEAQKQATLLRAAINVKAERIADLGVRRRYLRFTELRAFH